MDLENITVDILMPTYNRQKYLEEQIASLKEQTHKNIRIIISDDGSSDNTQNILKKYLDDENITIYFNEKNKGLIENMSFLLNKVGSKYFMLCDQDDVWEKTKVEDTLSFAIENNCDMVFTDLKVVDENLNQMYPSFNKFMLLDRKIQMFKKGKLEQKYLNYLYNTATGCTILCSKNMLEYILPLPNYSAHLIHDYWISLICSIKGKVGYLDKQTILYRQHQNNTIGTDKITHHFTNFEDVRNHFIKVKQGIFGTYVQKNPYFDKDMQEQNIKANKYYIDLLDVKYITLKGTKLFFKLYKYEPLKYKIENYIILNMPIIARPLFYIRYGILKLMGKR